MSAPVPSIRIPGVIRKSGESQLQIDNFKAEKFAQQYALFVEKCMRIDFFRHGSDEMLIGRAGYLSGALALQQKLNKKVVM